MQEETRDKVGSSSFRTPTQKCMGCETRACKTGRPIGTRPTPPSISHTPLFRREFFRSFAPNHFSQDLSLFNKMCERYFHKIVEFLPTLCTETCGRCKLEPVSDSSAIVHDLRREIAFFKRLNKWTTKQIKFINKALGCFKDKPGTELSPPIVCDLRIQSDYPCGAFFAKVHNHLKCLCTETCDRFAYTCKVTGDSTLDNLLKENLFFERFQVWIAHHLEERVEALKILSVLPHHSLAQDKQGVSFLTKQQLCRKSPTPIAKTEQKFVPSLIQPAREKLVPPLIQTYSEPAQRLLKRQDPEDTDSDEERVPPAKRGRGSREMDFWIGFGQFARIQGSKTGTPMIVTDTKNKHYQSLFEFGRDMPGKWFSKDAAIETPVQLPFTLTHITSATCPKPNSLVSVKVGRLPYFMVWEPTQ